MTKPIQSQVPIKASTVDATQTVNANQGFRYNGTAPSGQTLCGNGTNFVPSPSCGGSLTLYYQTMQLGGANRTQRPTLNFDGSFFNVTDNGGSNRTDVTLNSLLPTSITGNAGTATALAATPQQCTVSGQFSTGNAANGDANCSTPPGTSAPVCNSNGCYKDVGGGYYEMWTKSVNAPGSGSAVRLSVTFPITLTDSSTIHVAMTPVNSPNGDGNPHPMSCHVDSGSLGVSGFTAVLAIPQQISGSGYASPILTSQYCDVHVFGK